MLSLPSLKKSKSVRNIYLDFQTCIEPTHKQIVLKPSILGNISRSISGDSSSTDKDSLASSSLSSSISTSQSIKSESQPHQDDITPCTEDNDYDTFWDADDQDFCPNNGSGCPFQGASVGSNASFKIGTSTPLQVRISSRRLVTMTKWATERRMSLDEVVHLSFQIPPSYRKGTSSVDNSTNSSTSSGSSDDSGGVDDKSLKDQKFVSKKRSSDNLGPNN